MEEDVQEVLEEGKRVDEGPTLEKPEKKQPTVEEEVPTIEGRRRSPWLKRSPLRRGRSPLSRRSASNLG